MSTITPKEFAAKVDSDPRTVRKFLRNELGTVGKGQRWAIEAKQVRSLSSKFSKWDEARKTADDAPTEDNEAEAPADA
jgi:hypothetical protein